MINSPKGKDAGITNHYSPFGKNFYNFDIDSLMPLNQT